MRLIASSALVLIHSTSAYALTPGEHQWVPNMAKCGISVYQFICTVSDKVNELSTCRPDQTSAAENAWRRFTDDFGIDEQTTLHCQKLW